MWGIPITCQYLLKQVTDRLLADNCKQEDLIQEFGALLNYHGHTSVWGFGDISNKQNGYVKCNQEKPKLYVVVKKTTTNLPPCSSRWKGVCTSQEKQYT